MTREQVRPPMAGSGRRAPSGRSRFIAAAVAICATVGGLVFLQVARPWPTGDEPHYLVYARSLAEGWGVDLTRAYEPSNHEPFFAHHLEPHALRYAGEGGRFATWHGIGLPILLVPALMLSMGAGAARAVMLLIYALVVYHLFHLVLRVTGIRSTAVVTAVLLTALSPPLLYYASQVYPETAGVLLLIVGLRALLADRAPAWRRWGGASAAVGLLPWFNLRFAPLSLALSIALVTVLARSRDRRWGTIGWALGPVIVLGGLLVMFNLEVYGHIVPPPQLVPGYVRPVNLYFYGLGGVLGVPGGLVPLAPIFLVGVAALGISSARLGAGIAFAVGAALLYLVPTAYFGGPGFAPPGRYLLVIVPFFAVPTAVALLDRRIAVRAGIASLAALTLISVVTSAGSFGLLFDPDRRGEVGVQPLDLAAPLFPLVAEERRPVASELAAADLVHEVGRAEMVDGEPALVARKGRDERGVLAWVEPVRYRPGRYIARFRLWGGTTASRRPGRVDVLEPGGALLAGRALVSLPPRGSEVALPFETRGEEGVELRAYYEGSGVLGLRSITVELVRELPTRAPEREWWKALAWIALIGAVGALWRRKTIPDGLR